MKPTNKYYDSYVQESVVNATLELMKTQNFEKLTISEICRKAKIARRTFYHHYDNKLEILEDYYNVLFKDYEDRLRWYPPLAPASQIRFFFKFANYHRDFLKMLYDQNLFYSLLNRFSDFMAYKAHQNNINFENEYDLAYACGGLWATIYTWARNDFKQSHQELARVVNNYLDQEDDGIYV